MLGLSANPVWVMMNRLFSAVLFSAAASQTAPAQTAPYDLILRNGRIVDGTGSPWYRADIAIRGDAIVRIAPTINEPAEVWAFAFSIIGPLG